VIYTDVHCLAQHAACFVRKRVWFYFM